MVKALYVKLFRLIFFGLIVNWFPVFGQTAPKNAAKDSARYQKQRRPYANWRDRAATRFSTQPPRSPFYLKDPKNVKNDFNLDRQGKMSVYEPITTPQGKRDFRTPELMTYPDFLKIQDYRVTQRAIREYAAERDGKSSMSGRGLLPKLDLPPVFDRIFGSNGLDFKPNGFVLLDFGIIHQNIDNPQIPIRLRRTTNFNFNEQININFNGKIGDKLGLLTNFDTKASFNFENALRLNYKADEESMLQKVEAGNISWPLQSQLIPGVQNLFGGKVQFRLGRTNVTLVGSQQRSKQETITLRGGLQGKNFEIRMDSYDENRHFFLSQFFRNNYEKSLKNLPMITSGVTITRVEVYVTNRSQSTETLRNIAAFSDLGEARPYATENPNVQPIPNPNAPVGNESNGLFKKITDDQTLRQSDKTVDQLNNRYGLRRGIDYDILRGAKRLSDRDFKFHPELGYISLNNALLNDEILAVSYEYSYQGRSYKVGELTEDYQVRKEDEVLVLKLLKSSNIRNNTNIPLWDLMMKNVYSLGTGGLDSKGFQLRIIYKDDLTGLDSPNLQEGRRLQNVALVKIMQLDRLNQLQDPQPDGNFDFVEGKTVDSRMGRVIFPVLEPFGTHLNKFFDPDEEDLRQKYVHNTLYRATRIDAQQVADKNKFFLKGSYQAGAAGTPIQLPYGVAEQSVKVTAGGVALSPGTDYVVEAQIGQLRITNESVMNSGREIVISYERPDLFQQQIRRLFGTRIDYEASPNLKLGFTGMNLRETPAGFLTRTPIGNEPVNNTILGADINFKKDSKWLTRMLDKLPLLQTKEVSNVQFQGEVAQMFPGINPNVRGVMVDDFESARTPFDLTRQPTRWRLGSTPAQFSQGSSASPLEFGYQRARISAYSVDNVFDPRSTFGSLGRQQPQLPPGALDNFYQKFYLPTDLYPGRSIRLINLPENILDIAYFPSERGMYNFNPNLDANGRLANPRKNFGAITRAIASDPDFDNANVEIMEFWMMDPFIGGTNGIIHDGSANPTPNTKGGKLVFNLGDISEDVIKDGRFNFENGLPIGEFTRQNVDSTVWGRVTKQQFLINAFSNQPGAREKQDVGLDGLNNNDERRYFNKDFLSKLPANLTPAARAEIEADPAGDDFKFYLNEEFDGAKKQVVERYKNFMGMQNNTPENNTNAQELTAASTNLPDIEDLNLDNTINDIESYYEYEIDLRPGSLQVNKGFVVDRVEALGATWFLFRVPVRQFSKAVGGINGFKNIRFARMYLTDWEQPVVLRFSQLQLVSTQYRKFVGDLNTRSLQEVPEPYDAQFKIATVSIEENGQNAQTANTGKKYVYAVPPGFVRDRDFTQQNVVELNEQSMSLCVTNLRDGDSRAAFKNVNLDLNFRKRLKMFVHMHNDQNESDKVNGFLRLGTDFTEHYYEIEVQNLRSTPENVSDPNVVWPESNIIDVAFSDLVNAKSERNRQGKALTVPFSIQTADGRYRITVVGNPDLSAVMTLMIGVRNPRDDEQAKSFCLWVDELHVEGFSQSSGTAAIFTTNIKLADFATVQATGRISTFGFGGVQQKIGDRARETTKEIGLSANVQLDKLLPEKWGFRIPVYINYDHRNVDPHFNPLNPDTPLETSLSELKTAEERDRLRSVVQENTTRRGINFSNVRKTKVNPTAKRHFWDFENLAFTYAYNDLVRSSILISEYNQLQHKAGVAYQYAPQNKPWEPFKNVALRGNYLQWLKDFNFNPVPTLISVRVGGDRSFIKTQLRNSDLSTGGQQPLYEKYFLLSRNYDLNWNLTKNMNLTYTAAANAVVDEPIGELNTPEKSDSLWRNFRNLGRMKNFDQRLNLTYQIPLDKIPALDWMQATYSHRIGYQYQANSLNIKDSLNAPFGNIIRNNREYGFQGKIDFVRLYNKLRYLQFANNPRPARKNFARSPGDDEDLPAEPSRALKDVTRVLMTVRGIDVNYTVTETTQLAGFLPDKPRALGLDVIDAPGLPFIFGSQNRDIHRIAASREWLTRSTVLNTPFLQTIAKSFTARARLEPFKGFNVQLEMRLTRQDAYQEFFRPETTGGDFVSQSPLRNGQFSMSFMSFRTAFRPVTNDNSSPTFQVFQANREILKQRLQRENGLEYTSNSQDVLIPAFFAAYNDKDPEKVTLNPFFSFPFPNWRVDYAGLAQLPAFKKIFKSFTFQHSYSSTYSVGNFTSSLDYAGVYVNLAVMDYRPGFQSNLAGQIVPIFIMSTITMQEKFSPLIGIQSQLQNGMSLNLAYNKDRSIALSLSNAQVAELVNDDITATWGVTRKNVRIPFRINGKYQRLKNDLQFQTSVTFRDTRAIQRRLDGESIPINGNINFQLQMRANYVVNKLWSLSLYFDRMFNNPVVTNSFRRATTAGGVQVKFNVAEL